jgi:hypothetical protein
MSPIPACASAAKSSVACDHARNPKPSRQGASIAVGRRIRNVSARSPPPCDHIECLQHQEAVKAGAGVLPNPFGATWETSGVGQENADDHDEKSCGDHERTAFSLLCETRATNSGSNQMLTAVENGGAGRSKMVALGGVDLP